MAIADRIVVMNRGRIEDEGSPSDIYMRPRSLFSAGFMGEVNFIEGKVSDHAGGQFRVATAMGPVTLPQSAFTTGTPDSGDPVTILIRPEQFRASPTIADQLQLGAARIVDGAFFGTHYRCHVVPSASPDLRFVAHLPQTADLAGHAEIVLMADRSGVVALKGHVGRQGS